MSIFEVNSAPLNTSAQMLQKASNVLGSCKIGVANGNKRLVKAGGFGLGNYRKRLGAAENTLRDLSNDLAQLSKALYAVEQLSRQSDLAVYHQLNGTMNLQDTAQRLAEKVFEPFLGDAIFGLNAFISGVGAFIQNAAPAPIGTGNDPDEPIVLVLNDTGINSSEPTEIPIITSDQPTVTSGNTENAPAGSGNIKPYTHNDRSYAVVQCYSNEYLQKQRKNNNCTTTSEAIANSMKYDRRIDQSEMDGDSNSWATWSRSNVLSETKYFTAEERMQKAYELIRSGEPVIFTVIKPNNPDNGHTVVIIGVREGADFNNLQPSDFLVADPITGGLRTLDVTMRNNGYVIPGNIGCWSLKTAK